MFYFIISYFTSLLLFYNLLYFLFIVIFVVLYLFTLQLDLFGLFLLMTELVVFFVSLLLVFNLTAQGEVNKTTKYEIKLLEILIVLFFFLSSFIFTDEVENYLPEMFVGFEVWENYYESLHTDISNDLFPVFSVLYYNHSFLLVLIGYILLIGSFVCVTLNKVFLKFNFSNYANILDAYEFLSDVGEAFFLRKQNLNNQTTHETTTKEFKKK